MSVHLAISYFLKSKNDLLIAGIVAVSSLGLLLVPGAVISSTGFEVELSSPLTLIPLVLGAMSIPLISYKEKWFAKFFKLDFKTQRGISRAGYFFFFGIGASISYFIANEFGLLLLTIGFGAQLMYGKRSGAMWNILLGLLSITLLGPILSLSNLEGADLSAPRVIMGLFIAAGLALVINTFQRARKNQMLANAIMILVPVVLIVIVIFIGTQSSQLGGVDAFVGMIVGFGMTAMLGINVKKKCFFVWDYCRTRNHSHSTYI